MEILTTGTGRQGSWRLTPLRIARLISVTILGLLVTAGLFGQVGEYQVKAAFLFNFARYVEWPSETFSSKSDPIVICVLGQNPFGSALEQSTSGKAVDGRFLVIHEISDIRPGCHCQILFVNADERKRFRSAFATLRDAGVLTVGDTPGFTKDGGVVNFKLEEGKVRFEINVEAAAQEHLHISSKLLSLAEIVRN